MLWFGKGRHEEEHTEISHTEVLFPDQQEQRSGKGMVPKLSTFACTNAGNRRYQQDAVYVSPGRILASNKKTRLLAIVCDGMGGMADGGKASQTALQMMVAGFSRIEKDKVVDIPRFFQQGIRVIDRTVAEFPKENGRGSGTTLVAGIFEDNYFYWASVGDSRIYMVRGGMIRQISRDHNYWMTLSQMVQAGQITEEEAWAQKQKEALISYLGMGNVSLMDISTVPIELQYGDVVLFCSDGVTKTLPDEQIQQIIMDGTVAMEKKADAIVSAATHINCRTQDNTSAALVFYHEDEIRGR